MDYFTKRNIFKRMTMGGALVRLTLALFTATAATTAFSADTPPPPAPAESEGVVRLFILTGQSNMKHVVPEKSFTPIVEAAFPNDEIIVVKYAYTGQPIKRWYKDWMELGEESTVGGIGDIYETLMGMVATAMEGKEAPATVALIWMQGENDTDTPIAANAYAERFQGLLQQFRTDLGRNDLYFVVGRLSDHSTAPDWITVRESLVKAAESSPLGGWVDTDDLNGKLNDVHFFPKDGYQTLGERFGHKIVSLLTKATPPTTAVTSTTATPTTAAPTAASP